MTLYKQILAFVICLFAGLLIIAYAVQFQSTRDYLAEQQRISVINTANSVGLALTPYLEAGIKSVRSRLTLHLMAAIIKKYI